jgi:peptide deformylase
MEEGCLSIPGVREEVKRAERVTVEYMDREGKNVQRDAEGLLARVIQHETDHLNGKFYVDRISPLKRRFLQNKLNSIARHGFQAEEE